MPLVAFALRYAASQERKLQRLALNALRREMRDKAREVLAEARGMIVKGGGRSAAPGSPFRSQRGVTKGLLGIRVGKHSAYVGFKRQKARTDKKTGKKVGPARAVPNILEHGARHMAARPVLEPALERVKRSPFRARL